MQAGVVIFCIQDDNDVLYCGIANQPFHSFSSQHFTICFLSILCIIKFFVKDFCETMQARVVIFGMQVDNDVLYYGIMNQPSHAYSYLYLSDFLSFITLNNEVFRQNFCETMQTTVIIFGMQVNNDVLYRLIANQPSDAYSSLYLSDFLSFHTLNDEIFRQRFL